jgi:peptide/nickel transport system substrate-binding protein
LALVTLTFEVLERDTTAANQLLTGALDVATIQGPDLDRMLADKSLVVSTSSSAKLNELVMNATAGRRAADPQLRRAIMVAISPEEWKKAAYNGRGVMGTSIFGKDTRCYESETAKVMPPYSLETARQILTSAGYVPGPDGKLTEDGNR